MSIGIARFDSHEDLHFVPALVKDLGAVLRELDYDVDEHAHSTLSSTDLGAAVTDVLGRGGQDDVMIVHLATHGHLADGNATVFALGSDGTVDKDTSVAHWLTMRQAEERTPTLFLLDLCSAGTSARLPWQVALGGETRSWVIAACRSDQAAYDGRFTQAMITVLRALLAGELDVDPSAEYVSLATVARAVRQEVNRLAAESDSYGQQVTASLVDLSDDATPRFFRNPAYQPGGRPRLRADLDPAVLPFLDDLDEGLDARHFLERATGLGRLSDTSTALVGCFTGRDQELREISPWLNGHGRDTPLCVVTGSPGSGKSALLGVLVCAANPLLRAATEPVWKKVAQWPLPVKALAAVHARQRGLATIVASVSRQLGLPENLTAAELVAKLAKRTDHPVLVVDALDEADGSTEIMTELLLPLVDSSVRVLVGVRNYREYAPLLDRAWLVNLDDVDPDVLEGDLFSYVSSLLRTTDYRKRGAVTGAFAQAVAAVLATGESTWGPFLVAGLYTRHLVTAFTTPVTDPDEAHRLGQAVPAGLPDVLELDLRAQPDQVWLRPVLRALAHARGGGMPVSVLARVAPVFAPALPAPAVAEIQAALKAGKFYLRQAMDSDRSNVYRLFHQGLADTLAQRPFALAGPYLDALLARLGPAEQRDWEAAEPYLFRYVADHAEEADRLSDLENDPELYLYPESADALSGSLATLAERFAGVTSAAELALAAVRGGRPELARRAANIPGHALTWQPLWTLGTPLPRPTPAAPQPLPGEYLVAVSADGAVVATARDNTFRVHRHGFADDFFPALDGEITALALSPDGKQVLVGCVDGQLLRYDLDGRGGWIASVPGNPPIAAVLIRDTGQSACVAVDGTIAHWESEKSSPEAVRTRYQSRHWSLVASPTELGAYCLGDGKVVFVNARTGSLVEGFPVPFDIQALSGGLEHVVAIGSKGEVARYDRTRPGWQRVKIRPAVACLAVNAAGYAVFGGSDGSISYSAPHSGPASLRVSRDAAIAAVAIGADVSTVAAVDEFGGVHVSRASEWSRISSWTPAVVEITDEPDVTALGPATRRAVLGWSDGSIRDVDPRSGELGERLSLFDEPVIDIDERVIAGRETVLVSSNRQTELLMPGVRAKIVHRVANRFAVDTVLHKGQLVSTRVSKQGEFIIWVVSEFAGTNPEGLHPDARIVRHGYLGDRAVAYIGGDDGVVRVWELDSRAVIAELVIGQPILQMVVGDVLLVRTASEVVAFGYGGVSG